MNLFKKGWRVTEDPDDEPRVSRQQVLEKAAKDKDHSTNKAHEKALEDSFPASDPPAANVFD